MQELIKTVLTIVNFSDRYLSLCKRYQDYDHGMNFEKGQLENLINQHDSGFTYASKEKLFYKDYSIDDLRVRFIVTYKYGFIDCLYAFSSINNDNRFRGGLGAIAGIQDPQFESKVSYKFPIATSMQDLESILKSILNLNSDFMLQLKGAQVNK